MSARVCVYCARFFMYAVKFLVYVDRILIHSNLLGVIKSYPEKTLFAVTRPPSVHPTQAMWTLLTLCIQSIRRSLSLSHAPSRSLFPYSSSSLVLFTFC